MKITDIEWEPDDVDLPRDIEIPDSECSGAGVTDWLEDQFGRLVKAFRRDGERHVEEFAVWHALVRYVQTQHEAFVRELGAPPDSTCAAIAAALWQHNLGADTAWRLRVPVVGQLLPSTAQRVYAVDLRHD
jgi:hypothetical protein